VPVSVSRIMDRVVTAEHAARARRLRALIAHYEAKRDLVTLGAYPAGSDVDLDFVLGRLTRLDAFLSQAPGEVSAMTATVAALEALLA
jgi:flagellar biosynthesis/type III secretory pathway ATPase